jgi:hypothetical protein
VHGQRGCGHVLEEAVEETLAAGQPNLFGAKADAAIEVGDDRARRDQHRAD